MIIKIKEYECYRCGHTWIPRHTDVRQCPKCRSVCWDIKLDSDKGGSQKFIIKKKGI